MREQLKQIEAELVKTGFIGLENTFNYLLKKMLCHLSFAKYSKENVFRIEHQTVVTISTLK